MKSLRIFTCPEDISKEIARCLYKESEKAVKNQHPFSIAVSGGSTDPSLYAGAATPQWKDRIAWEWVHIFWADERCVPPKHQESNYRIVSNFLLNHINIPKENIHRIRGEEDPVEESLRYSKEIEDHRKLRKGDENFFDWVLLGMGVDGHTASLFPGRSLFESRNICEAVQHPETGQNRVTLTPMAINRSNRITYHIIGRRKAMIMSKVASAFSAKKQDYPVEKIFGDWFVDSEAASKLNF